MRYRDPEEDRLATRRRPHASPKPRLVGRRWGLLLLCLTTLAPGACRTGLNYTDAVGPRYAGPVPVPDTSLGWRDTLRVVSFNVEWGRSVDSALAVFAGEPDLADADLVLLQEMDEAGSRRMAEALGLGFVYYPAIHSSRNDRDFGNAVLSRWPIVQDEKLLLPHHSIFGRTQRIATVVTVQVGRIPVRVYSVHLATPPNLALRDRMDQMRTVLRDARKHPHVVIGGDLNSGRMARMAAERGYAWPTRDGPRTVLFGRWDHIMFKGLALPDSDASGTVEDNRGASDHLPVWAVGVVR